MLVKDMKLKLREARKCLVVAFQEAAIENISFGHEVETGRR